MSSSKGIELGKDNSLNQSGQVSDNQSKCDDLLEKINKKDLRIILDSIIAGVAIVDAQTHEIIDCNLLASKMIGLPKEKIIGKLCSQFMHPAGEDECPVSDLSQSVNNYECALLNSEGEETPILKTVTPVIWQDHSYFIESFTDITELKNKEKESWEINERYRALVNDSVLGITIIDPEYKIITTNSTFCKLFKKSAEEFVGKYCYKEYEKRDEVCSHCPGRRAMATGYPADVETQAVLDDGTRIHVRNRAVPFFSQDGQLKGFIEMIEDIDKKKKMEEALRKSEERFRIAAKTSSDLIRELDIETGQLEWFGDVDGKLGYKQREFPRTQQAWESIIHPDDYPQVRNEFDKLLKEGQPYNTGYRVRKKDGSFLYWSDSGTTLLDDKGNPNRVIGVCSDITDQKHTEQEQMKILQQLKKANEELSSFGYIVSHDLKAPLRGVKVLVDWIYKDYMDKIDEEGKQKMDLLVSRVDRMHNLIDGILQYSKIGRLEEEKSQVNLGELMPDIIDMVSPPENIEIIIKNELPIIECGQIRIAQIFQNLLSNAIKYMDKPQGLIKIGCVEDRNFWKFSVKDNGPGIAEEYFEKIFQMYQTLTPRDNYESTGVGLTVVKKIVDLYGGKIWVESQVGQGCTFIFTIPKLQEQKERNENEKLQTNFVS